jgi:hypothetical protein
MAIIKRNTNKGLTAGWESAIIMLQRKLYMTDEQHTVHHVLC